MTGITSRNCAGLLVTGLLAAVAAALLFLTLPAQAQSSVPDAPARPAATTVSHESVTLSWADPSDPSITGYQVLRRNRDTDDPGDFTVIEDDTASSATTYTDSGVDSATRYTYRIKARNANGLSPQSSYRNVTTPADPVPAAPSRPAASSVSHNSVTLSWADPSDTSITGYQVLRRNRDTDAIGDFTVIEDDTGNTGTTYTDNGVAGSSRYTYRVKARNSHGLSPLSSFRNVETPEAPANSPATGAPTITGTPQFGETLTADTSGISDSDGLTAVQYAYQWIRSSGGTDTDIAGATGSTNGLVLDDVGNTVKVRVAFTDDGGNSESLTSSATAEVTRPSNQSPTGLPSISGTIAIDEILTASISGISDGNGLTNAQFGYQWVHSFSGTDMDISGKTGSTYTITSTDAGKSFKVRVTFTDDDGYAESLTSGATDHLLVAQQSNNNSNNPATGLPTITGTAEVGETLTADTSGISDSDGLTNVSYSYQWIRSLSGTDTEVSGATGSTHTLTDDDIGEGIKVRVTFTDDGGNSESLTSTATALVRRPNQAPVGVPAITGTLQVGEALTADTSGISDGDGLVDVTYSYQWIRSLDGTDTDIAVATGSAYTLTEGDRNYAIKVRVTFTDNAGNLELIVSAATGILLESNPQTDTNTEPDPSEVDTRLECLVLHIAHDTQGNVLRRSLTNGVDSEGVPHETLYFTLPSRLSWVTVEPKPFASESALIYTFTQGWDDPGTDLADADASRDGHQVNLTSRVTRFTLKVAANGDPNNSTVYQVQIRVPEVQHAPEFTDGASTTLSVDENTGGPANVGQPLAATDENLPVIMDELLQNVETAVYNEELTYSIVGNNNNFSIHPTTGQIKTRRDMNYEVDDATYSLTARVTDRSGRSDTISVTIQLNNVDEPGWVAMSPLSYEVGTTVTARVSRDSDGGVTGVTWQWHRCSEYREGGDCEAISGATSATYTPAVADGGWRLKAVASYTDNQGSGKSAEYLGNRVPATQSVPTTLRKLTINGTDITLSSSQTRYSHSVSVGTATVQAIPTAPAGAAVFIIPRDDSTSAGHQVSLDVGQNTITIIVLDRFDSTTTTYTVRVTRS